MDRLTSEDICNNPKISRQTTYSVKRYGWSEYRERLPVNFDLYYLPCYPSSILVL